MRITFRRLLAVFSLSLVLAVPAIPDAEAAGDKTKVLILGPTVSGGTNSVEAVAATALGYTVDVVTAAQWSAMSQADFAAYRSIVLGDPYCSGRSAVTAAEANANTWGAAVTGNVVVVGTDPVYHAYQGGRKLTEKGIAFASANSIFTGAYITLSCYYHGTAPNTPVPLLNGFGNFTARGVGCYNDAHIVADHPALEGLTDANLSNWSCSVHEGIDRWPADFSVLAIARGIGGIYTAPDGSVGTPYIVARGVNCGEVGLDALKATPAKGVASGVVHDTAEPVVYGVSPDAQAVVHQVNCQTVVAAEDAVDGALGG